MDLESDQEYDELTRKVWEETQRSRGIVIPREQTSDSDEEEQGEFEGEGSQSGELFKGTLTATTEDEAIILSSESDQNSGTDGSSDSYTSQDSTLSQEQHDLLVEVVEVISREQCDSGSLLDVESELPWKETIQKFIFRQERQGYRFKTEEESLDDFRQNLQKEERDDELFEGIFMDDKSNDDDALDEDWEPSNNEPDIQEVDEHRQGEIGDATDTLFAEFYEYLVDVDGGYRSAKVAQQYKSQVQSVIRTCKMKLTERETEKHEHQGLPSFHLLLIPGMSGVKFLRSWLSYAVEKYQPGTVWSYLMSVRLFYKFSRPRGKEHTKRYTGLA